jgi:hypothetical protein
MDTKYNNVSAFNNYNNFRLNQSKIKKENRNKRGIYRFINRTNNYSYIGRSVDLTRRFSEYYNINLKPKKFLKGNSHIHKALLYYGYDNFYL